jgi:hypothetical protein
MTIATTASKVTQQGNGATTVWPYAFEIPGDTTTDQSNVIVTLVDSTVSPAVTTELADNLYSITGINNPGGGNVTYPLSGTPIAAGVSITIQRDIPYEQPFDFPNQSAFYGTVVTAAYDWCVMQIQQLLTLLTYTLQFPITDTTPPVTLPIASERAGGYLGFDGAGQPTIYGAPGGGSAGGSFGNRTITSSSVLSTSDCYVRCNANSGSQSNTLPSAASMSGRMMVFKKIDSSANPVTISGDANIDGASSFTLAAQYNAITIYSNGTVWDILNQF